MKRSEGFSGGASLVTWRASIWKGAKKTSRGGRRNFMVMCVERTSVGASGNFHLAVFGEFSDIVANKAQSVRMKDYLETYVCTNAPRIKVMLYVRAYLFSGHVESYALQYITVRKYYVRLWFRAVRLWFQTVRLWFRTVRSN